MTAPHGQSVPSLRHGGFWIPGDQLATETATFQRGPMWVEWFAPAVVTHPLPVVLVHGGGGQGSDWIVTPDGRPGWASRLAEKGHAVYVVDRPGHGRSPHHPAVLGEPGGQFSTEATIGLFAPPEATSTQTQWPWARDGSGAQIQQLAASGGFFLQDLGDAQELDARRLVALLAEIGPAVLVTHSAGAPGGWLAASRTEGVRGIVALEPMGPPYVSVPGLGELAHGLTAVPLGSSGLTGLRVTVLTGSASPFAAAGAPVIDFLTAAGADAEHVPLEALGIIGNGHGLMFEANSDQIADAVAQIIAGYE